MRSALEAKPRENTRLGRFRDNEHLLICVRNVSSVHCERVLGFLARESLKSWDLRLRIYGTVKYSSADLQLAGQLGPARSLFEILIIGYIYILPLSARFTLSWGAFDFGTCLFLHAHTTAFSIRRMLLGLASGTGRTISNEIMD